MKLATAGNTLVSTSGHAGVSQELKLPLLSQLLLLPNLNLSRGHFKNAQESVTQTMYTLAHL